MSVIYLPAGELFVQFISPTGDASRGDASRQKTFTAIGPNGKVIPMKIHRLVFVLPIVAVFYSGASVAEAQIRRYQPNSPTVSPYLNLDQPEGALPNYYSRVRPLQLQRRFEEGVIALGRQQSLFNRKLEQELGQPTANRPQQAGWFNVGGAGATFQNTGRYYGQIDRGRRPLQR
jgi:hypothetical protein